MICLNNMARAKGAGEGNLPENLPEKRLENRPENLLEKLKSRPGNIEK
jgi:hypothetical protein